MASNDKECAAISYTKKYWKVICVLSTVFAFFVATFVQLYTLQETLKITRYTNRVNLTHNLYNEFKGESLYRKIEDSIVRGETLYIGLDGTLDGKYTYDEINSFLGFFELLGLYHKMEVLELFYIDYLFGGVILEAYLDGDIMRYVHEIRMEGGQSTVFIEFQNIAEKLIKKPSRASHVKKYARDGFTEWES